MVAGGEVATNCNLVVGGLLGEGGRILCSYLKVQKKEKHRGPARVCRALKGGRTSHLDLMTVLPPV